MFEEIQAAAMAQGGNAKIQVTRWGAQFPDTELDKTTTIYTMETTAETLKPEK